MRKRLTYSISSNSEKDYKININELNVKEEYKTKMFNSYDDIFLFVSQLFSTKSYNNILFALSLLTKIDSLYKLKEPEVLIDTNFLTEINELINLYINDKKVINSILSIFINLTYTSDPRKNQLFFSIQYLYNYKKIINTYSNDEIIIISLFTMFGNIVTEDKEVQKMFFESGLFDVMINVASVKRNNKIKEISVWLLACFVQGIGENYFFKDKSDSIMKCQNLLFENIIYEDYTHFCLIGLGALAESEDSSILHNFVDNPKFFEFLFSLHSKHYLNVCKILCNLASNNAEIDLILINNCGLIDFMAKGLENESPTMCLQVLFILNNIIADDSQEVYNILIEKKIIEKLFFLARNGYNPALVKNAIEIIKELIIGSEYIIIEQLSEMGIVDVLVDILKKNFDGDLICNTLEGVFNLLRKDKLIRNMEKTFYKQIENKGGKDVLERIAVNGQNKEVAEKAEHLLKLYFNGKIH